MLTLALAVFLMLNLGVGMWRVPRGPTTADRMLAAQLFGTTAVAVLLLLAETPASAAQRDVALVFALLCAVTAVLSVRRAPGVGSGDGRDRLRAGHSEAQAVRRAQPAPASFTGAGALGVPFQSKFPPASSPGATTVPFPLVRDTTQPHLTGELVVDVQHSADGGVAPWDKSDGRVNPAYALIASQLVLLRTAGTL